MNGWSEEHTIRVIFIIVALFLMLGCVFSLPSNFPHFEKYLQRDGSDIMISAYACIGVCLFVYLLCAYLICKNIDDFRYTILFLLLGLLFLKTYFLENVIALSLWSLEGKSFIDFPSFYYVAKEAVRGSNMYDYSHIRSLVHQESSLPIYPFLYHPFAIAIFIPLTKVKYFIAQNIILAINHALIPAIFYLSYRAIKIFRENRTIYVCIACISLLKYYPLRENFDHGQVNIFVLFGIVSAYYFFKKKRDFLCSVCLVFSIILKQVPIIFILYFMFLKRWRIVYYTLGLLVILTILCIPLFGTETLRSYAHLIRSCGYTEEVTNLCSPAHVASNSLNSFFTRLFVPNMITNPPFKNTSIGKILCYISSLVILLLTFVSNREDAKPREEVLDTRFNLLLAALFLVSPLGWEHHLVILFIPCVYIFVSALSLGWEDKKGFIGLSLLALILISYKINVYPPDIMKSGIFVLLISLKFYGALVLWGLLYHIQGVYTQEKSLD